jgi:polyphosphate kinase 2 (PPK2 family)
LVERVEGFATEAEWRRAYEEINSFENQLVEHGTTVLKYWLHIDPDEQIRRFGVREQIGYKQHKIDEEDYRNREKWPQYVEAAEEMFSRTCTESAPWIIVPANDKRHARIEVLKKLCNMLEESLDLYS